MAAGTSATILVIDDEPSITRGLAQLLRRDGYTVATAANGRHALAQLHAQPYDVIVSDLQMHDLDGRTFYTLLLQQYPALRQRVIFLTADDDAADSQAFLARCGQPWLPKPCPIAVLRSTIRQVLAVAVAAPPCTQAGRTSHARSQQLAHQSQTLRTRSQGLLDKVQALYAKSTRLRTGAAVLRASYRARACHARQRSL